MKRIIFYISFIYFSQFSFSQDLITKIPANASVVASFNSQNFISLLSLEDFANTTIGAELNKMLGKETRGRVLSLKKTAFDFSRSSYYFMKMEQRSVTNTFLIPLKDASFDDFISEYDKKQFLKEGKNTYRIKTSSSTTSILMWDENMLVMSFNVALTNEFRYYRSSIYNKELGAREENTESREQWEARKEEYREKVREAVFLETLDVINSTPSKSILTNANYSKSKNTSDEIHAWVGYETLFNSYAYFLEQSSSFLRYNDSGVKTIMDVLNILNTIEDFTIRLDFEEEYTSLKTETTVNKDAVKRIKKIYKSQFHKPFFNYFNENKTLGYLSINVDSKAILDSYYNIADNITQSFGDKEYMGREQTVFMAFDLGYDLLSILLDEEAIAEIVTGNLLLEVSGFIEREVTYTSYKYDDDFNYTPVEKTKTETIPDFLFAFTTETKDIYEKMLKIGMKEKLVSNDNNLYELHLPKNDFPINLYMLFDGEALLISSSKERLSQIQKGTYKSYVSSLTQKVLKENCIHYMFKAKKVINQLPQGMLPYSFQKDIELLKENASDISFSTNKLKGNKLVNEIRWKVPDSKKENSFAFIINMIDSFYTASIERRNTYSEPYQERENLEIIEELELEEPIIIEEELAVPEVPAGK